MRAWLIGVTSGVLCATLGFAIATRLADEPAPPLEDCAKPLRAVPRPMFRPRATISTHTVSEASCEGEHLRATWCHAQLDACQREGEIVREAWPDDAQIESPAAWSTAVEDALQECDLGAELEYTECTEYPCTAALRPSKAPASEKAHEAEMKRLMEAARGCAPLQDAFGVQPGAPDSIDVFRLDANCGDTGERFFVLMALDPGGPAYELLHTKDRTDTQERDFNRWIYRRADDIASKWPCGAAAG